VLNKQSLKAAIVFDCDVTVETLSKNALNLRNVIKSVTFLVSTLFLVEPWPTKSELRCAYYGRNKLAERLIRLTSKNLPLTSAISLKILNYKSTKLPQ
jgi:hypothetical protein